MVSELDIIIERNDAEEPLSLNALGEDEELTDAYTITLEAPVLEFPTAYKIITVRNMHTTEDLYFTLYVSDEEEPEEEDWCVMIGEGGVKTEQLLSVNSITYETFSEPWQHVRIYCKAKTLGNTSSVRVRVRSVNR